MSRPEPHIIADAARGIRHVFIRNLELPAEIGVWRHERGKAQPVRINVDLAVEAPASLFIRRIAVAPGTPCTINVTFTPTATGTQTGTLVITDNAVGSPQTIHLSGYGASGAVSLSASSLDFGTVEVGATSTQTVTLTNPAQSPLDISSIQAGGDYSETNNCGSVVNAGAGCTISVSFTPSAVGTSVGTVAIRDTGLGSPQTVTLTGAGGAPFALSANPSSETVLMGTSQAQFTLSASSSSGFTGSIVLGCANVAPATCAFNPASISPGHLIDSPL